MINYTPTNQLTLEGFKHPFYKHLKQDNRWVKLAEVIPWNELARIYSRNLDPGAGRLSVDIRMVIGALIIKHKLTLMTLKPFYQGKIIHACMFHTKDCIINCSS